MNIKQGKKDELVVLDNSLDEEPQNCLSFNQTCSF